jgi:serine/threonine protein kinase
MTTQPAYKSDEGAAIPSSFLSQLYRPGVKIDIGFDTFTMESLIGSGGLGVVVKARRNTGDMVALKFLYDSGDKGTEARRNRFINEIRTTKMVGDFSPRCVRVYECGAHRLPSGQSTPFFSMEYVPGLSLQDLIFLRQRPFNISEICALMWLIADALEDIHDRNIVHRDIKPSNILFDENRAILKVTDFGISKDLKSPESVTIQRGSQDSFIVGTIQYLSRYSFERIFIDQSDAIRDPNGYLVHRHTGVPVYRNLDGTFEISYKGKKLDLSVLASTMLFEIVTRHNPFRNVPITNAINDILSAKKLDIKVFCREHAGRVDPVLSRSSRVLSHIAAIIRKGSCPDILKTYSDATQLKQDIEKLGQSSHLMKFEPDNIASIMKNFFGVTLAEDYQLALSRMEDSFRNKTLHDDFDNIHRFILLYKLRRSDRLHEFLSALLKRCAQVAAADKRESREAAFYHKFFSMLHNFSTDAKHREAAEALS